MDTRIQQALDGELARSELNRDEAKQLAEAEAQIRGVVNSIPVQPLPDLSALVLAQAEAVEEKKTWLLRTQTITIRPIYGLLAAAVIAFVMLLPQRAAKEANPQIFVEFKLDAPGARNVSLAGDFTQWQPTHTLKRTNNGVWTIVVPLNPGVHDYAFVVDGERWVPDPSAPAIEDGFGGMNSRVAVLAPETRSM